MLSVSRSQSAQWVLGVVAALVATSAAWAQAPTPAPAPSPTPVVRSAPASKEELAAITARGRALAEYDQAAWLGTDAAMPALRGSGLTADGFYVADKVKGKWVVSFGRLNDARDQFQVFVEATQKGKNDYRATKFDTPKVETGRVLSLARAVSLCRAEFKGENRPYNIAVLPGPNDGWWVYVLPAQTDAAVFPVGGDVRYQVSPDGTAILETHRMHVSVQEYKGGSAMQGTPVMLVRTAVLDDAPEDSDVFYAMTFKPSTAQLLMTRNFVYQLSPDGQIRFVATVAEFMKK